MSGYKRVSFYELCRLCASNYQREKTHIFQEEGKKIELQTKIQACLSITVSESDFLPKVVCSKCLSNLETCYSFRQECFTSEKMLSTYFKNYRETEDFKKTGKVYIKDAKTNQQSEPPPAPAPTPAPTNKTVQSTEKPQVQQSDNVPYYTLHLPAIVSNPTVIKTKEPTEGNKVLQVNQNQVAFNAVNVQSVKTSSKVSSESYNNFLVNSSGEVINFSQLVDFDNVFNQNVPVINQVYSNPNNAKKTKKEAEKVNLKQGSGVKAKSKDRKEDEPHIKTNQNGDKVLFAVKVDQKSNQVNFQNASIVYNSMSDFSNNFAFNNNNLYTSTNSLNSANNENTTVNLNLLNVHDLNQQSYRNTSFVNESSKNKENAKQNVPVPNVLLNGANVLNGLVKVELNEAKKARVEKEEGQVRTHVCDICQRTFKRKEHLYQHVKLHTGFRPFTCESCNKSFLRKEHLVRHMTLHTGKREFVCEVCTKSFSRNDNLLKHRKIHEKQSSFTCEYCFKKFVLKHYYLAHKSVHTSKCGGCEDEEWG